VIHRFLLLICIILLLGTAVLWLRSYWVDEGLNCRWGAFGLWLASGNGWIESRATNAVEQAHGLCAVDDGLELVRFYWRLGINEGFPACWHRAGESLVGPPYLEISRGQPLGFLPVVWECEHARGFFRADATLPWWLVTAAVATYPGLSLGYAAVRACRRRRGNRCLHCGYDLTGNVSRVCPECGLRIDDRSAAVACVARRWRPVYWTGLTAFVLGLVCCAIAAGLTSGLCPGKSFEFGFYELAGTACLVVAIAGLLLTAALAQPWRRKCVIGSMCGILALAIYHAGSPALRDLRRPALEAVTKHTIRDLAARVEAVRSRTGCLPRNERDLVASIGMPMPRSPWGDRITYCRWGGGFDIDCLTVPWEPRVFSWRSEKGDIVVRRPRSSGPLPRTPFERMIAWSRHLVR